MNFEDDVKHSEMGFRPEDKKLDRVRERVHDISENKRANKRNLLTLY